MRAGRVKLPLQQISATRIESQLLPVPYTFILSGLLIGVFGAYLFGFASYKLQISFDPIMLVLAVVGLVLLAIAQYLVSMFFRVKRSSAQGKTLVYRVVVVAKGIDIEIYESTDRSSTERAKQELDEAMKAVSPTNGEGVPG